MSWSETDIERFRRNVAKGEPEECWPYRGNLDKGYGRLGYGAGKKVLAHRLAYELHYGRSPDRLLVCHTCDNPPCCNPKHLKLGTNKFNTLDSTIKGRRASGSMPYGVQRQSKAVRPRFRARVCFEGRHVDLGSFPTVQQAHFTAVEFRVRRDILRGQQPASEREGE